jgi:UDP-N-acetylmuramate dehydrogenase
MLLSQKLKKELGKNLKFNEPLRNWTTYRIGGTARYFFMVGSIEDLNRAIKIAQQFKIKYFIIGEGSNLLFPDKGFNGLVIKNKISKLEIVKNKVLVGAGVKLSYLALSSIKFGLTGLEWAIGIPGSVGGAVYQNAGAFGSDFSRSIKSVAVTRNGQVKNLSKEQCGFIYRGSIFKANNDIILEAELKLKKGKQTESQKLMKKYLESRRSNQPMGYSAGSVFKNPPFQKLSKICLKTYPQLQSFKDGGIIPAGWLIEKAGLKGFKIGGAQISEKHANFIINQGRAKAKDVLALIRTIKKIVKRRFDIVLNEEIQIL